jgi:phage tail-like protein
MTDSESTQQASGGTSRRDALKMAGAAAVGGFATTLSSSAPAGAALRAAAISGRFSVEIDGVFVVGLQMVEPITTESAVSYASDPSTGAITASPGPLDNQSVVLTKDWSNTSEWYNWRQSVVAGKTMRKAVVIRILDRTSSAEVARYTLSRAWPSKYTGPSYSVKNSGHLSESITVVYETLDFKKG